ncbi:hypothetical protein SAMN05216360_111150 [Methylobacterium phyllostachyos]|uniref:Uncharacterized protein n=1 Tax=Methylobacterium phyllostachyos TaxID=582672 RepID=A0A1H0EEI7_9HYPH|nr:hypothetical protein SAMN05216360_111150 [Methylobacterium phyllostachyos]
MYDVAEERQGGLVRDLEERLSMVARGDGRFAALVHAPTHFARSGRHTTRAHTNQSRTTTLVPTRARS